MSLIQHPNLLPCLGAGMEVRGSLNVFYMVTPFQSNFVVLESTWGLLMFHHTRSRNNTGFDGKREYKLPKEVEGAVLSVSRRSPRLSNEVSRKTSLEANFLSLEATFSLPRNRPHSLRDLFPSRTICLSKRPLSTKSFTPSTFISL